MSFDLLRSNPPAELYDPMLAYLPMVRRIVLKIRQRIPQTVEIDDLFSAGLVGLVNASAAYSASKQIPFQSFAKFRIKGAVLDFLRELDWAPRSLRRLARAAVEAELAAAERFRNTPTEEQIAAEMGIDLPSYQALARDLDNAEMISLTRDQEPSRDEEQYIQIPAPAEASPLYRFLQDERCSLIAKAIDELREPHRTVVRLSYFEDVTLRDIGQEIDLSESRVCQIRSEAERLLHQKLSLALQGACQ